MAQTVNFLQEHKLLAYSDLEEKAKECTTVFDGLNAQIKTAEKHMADYPQKFYEEHRLALCSSLLLSEKFYPHLFEVDQVVNERLEQFLSPMIKATGLTEKLKFADQMRWVGLMNVVKAQVVEIILRELIYC